EEPTQGVDVGAQERIHALLTQAAEDGRAILLVSSELGELRALADRVYVLYAGRVTAELSRDEATDERIGEAMTGTGNGAGNGGGNGTADGDTDGGAGKTVAAGNAE